MYDLAITRECNNGAVVVRSIGVSVINNTQCYISQLDVFASDEVIDNNETVTCLQFHSYNEIIMNTLLINTGDTYQ